MGSGSGVSCSINLNSTLTREQKELYQNPETIQRILNECKTIAIVGLSTDRQRASYFVASYMRSAGYRVIPVNPRADRIMGETCYPDLKSIPEPVDLVDIFRPSGDCLEIVKDAIAIKAKGVWLQLRIINEEAAEMARKAGLLVAMDCCVKMEHGRYCGGLHEAGMNTEIVSAQRVHRFV
jgi:predicted CoA-binding protein